MKRIKMMVLVGAMAFCSTLAPHKASATPTDSYFTWSWSPLRVASVGAGSDNDVYATFKNPDGSTRSVWPDSDGNDLCGGSSTLRLARARTNFKDILDGLNLAGLSGRSVWVAYEPTAGVCYIKSISVSM